MGDTLTEAVTDREYTVSYTPPSNATGSVDLTIASSSVTDQKGNGNEALTLSPATYDTINPTVTITADSDNISALATTTLTFLWNEAVVGFDDSSDISVSTGTIGSITKLTDSRYTAIYTAPPSDAIITVKVLADKVKDLVGNDNAETGERNIAYAAIPTIAISDTDLKIGEMATITIEWSTAVTGFTKDDIDITGGGGTLGNSLNETATGTSYNISFTPTVNVDATTTTIKINAGVATSSADATETNLASNVLTLTSDTKRPSVASVTVGSNTLGIGATTTVTITFSEAVQ